MKVVVEALSITFLEIQFPFSDISGISKEFWRSAKKRIESISKTGPYRSTPLYVEYARFSRGKPPTHEPRIEKKLSNSYVIE